MSYDIGDEVDIHCPCCGGAPAVIVDTHPDDFYTLECARCGNEFDVYEDVL